MSDPTVTAYVSTTERPWWDDPRGSLREHYHYLAIPQAARKAQRLARAIEGSDR